MAVSGIRGITVNFEVRRKGGNWQHAMVKLNMQLNTWSQFGLRIEIMY